MRHKLRIRAERLVEGALGRHLREQEQTIRREFDRVVRHLEDLEFRMRRDVLAAGERDAAAASARFAEDVMPLAQSFDHPHATLGYALSLAPAEGMALEFGVCTGQTLQIIADARHGSGVFGFDSFKGLPEDYRPHVREGTFQMDLPPQVHGAELVIGWFDETLPRFLAEHPGPVAFVHVDGDLYSSAKTVFEHVGPRLRPGSVVLFDEYFNYPGWEKHEHRAWQEFVASSGVEFRYEAYTMNNEQVAARVTAV